MSIKRKTNNDYYNIFIKMNPIYDSFKPLVMKVDKTFTILDDEEHEILL